MSEYVREVNEGNFAQVVLQSKTPTLVDFWADWCGPCRALAPIVEAVAEQYAKSARVVKLNVDESPTVTQRRKSSSKNGGRTRIARCETPPRIRRAQPIGGVGRSASFVAIVHGRRR